jgi:hypothetical protein
VTLLSRGTKYRRILNEAELVGRLEDSARFEQVTLATFSHTTPFLNQLEIIANTDILVSTGISVADPAGCLTGIRIRPFFYPGSLSDHFYPGSELKSFLKLNFFNLFRYF